MRNINWWCFQLIINTYFFKFTIKLHDWFRFFKSQVRSAILRERVLCADPLPENHARLPRDGKARLCAESKVYGGPRVTQPSSPTLSSMHAWACVRACIHINNRSHLSGVWVSRSPLCPEIPRTGWQVNSDCGVPLSIRVDPGLVCVCSPGSGSVWGPAGCAVSPRRSIGRAPLRPSP